MQIKSTDNSKEENFNQSLEIGKENITCKDGFCSLSTPNKNKGIQENKMNLFDPV